MCCPSPTWSRFNSKPIRGLKTYLRCLRALDELGPFFLSVWLVLQDDRASSASVTSHLSSLRVQQLLVVVWGDLNILCLIGRPDRGLNSAHVLRCARTFSRITTPRVEHHRHYAGRWLRLLLKLHSLLRRLYLQSRSNPRAGTENLRTIAFFVSKTVHSVVLNWDDGVSGRGKCSSLLTWLD